MAKEITSQDIRQKYVEEETKIIKNMLLFAIDIINDLLQKKYKEIVRDGSLSISSRELNWSAPSLRWDIAVNHLQEFFTSWNVQGEWVNNTYYINITPKQPIDKNIKIDLSEIKEKKKEITSNDIIENRAEILDL